MLAAYYVLAASALIASAVSGHTSGPPAAVKCEESETLGQADKTTAFGLVKRVKGDDERTTNLKYVLAIQNSSIWTDVKRRTLTISTDPRLAQVLDTPPREQCDRDLALLKRSCHDGLKCVAVDQLLVLQSVTETLGDGTTVVSVRRAIAKIAHVLKEYTTEYHEDAYQYEQVAETDDPATVSRAVTVAVEDNKELCKLGSGDESAITASETVSTVVSSRDDRNAMTDGEIVVDRPAPLNRGNVVNAANVHVPVVTGKHHSDKRRTRDGGDSDPNRAFIVASRHRDPQGDRVRRHAQQPGDPARGVDAVPVSGGHQLGVKVRSNPADETPAESRGDRKSGRPSAHDSRPIIVRATVPSYPRGETRKTAITSPASHNEFSSPAKPYARRADSEAGKCDGDGKMGIARTGAHDDGSTGAEVLPSYSHPGTRKSVGDGHTGGRTSRDEALIGARPYAKPDSEARKSGGDGKAGIPRPAHVKFPPSDTDATANTLNSKSNNKNTGNAGNNFVSFATGNGGGGGGGGGNDEDTDIVSVGDRNEGHVRKGYVEDGVINNGNMNLYNLNTGTYTKGIVDKSGAGRGGIINVGTLNNGPTNYGMASSHVNYGTESTSNDNDILQYLSSIDKMYSSVIDGLSEK